MANRLSTPTKKEGQRSEAFPSYLYRTLPQWNSPSWMESTRWRYIVRQQPVAMACRDTLISNLINLEWEVSSRDTTKRQDYKEEIDHYTGLFENPGWVDYIGFVETLCQDILDLPFGGAAEVGRLNDDPNGRVEWLKNLDGATLFPTLNLDYPVIQKSPYNATEAVYFPKHAIARTYYSPRPELKREGWGMSPPEKIYLALELLWRGDQYYANLLLDTPQAGILDLGDMEKSTAKEWVESFRDLMNGINAFKIPVLYEHTSQTKWIPFTKPPTEMMFDGIISKYASLVCAGYGITLGDIGFTSTANGGETLSGTIRQERKTRRNGLALLKKKVKAFYDSILPKYLEWVWVDFEEEVNVSLGRARLSNATAMYHFIKNKIITPEEARLQLIKDGVFNIPIPDDIPDSELVNEIDANNNAPLRPGTLGDPVNPSLGGHGEVTNKSLQKGEIQDVLREGFYPIFDNLERGIKEIYQQVFSIVKPKITQSVSEFEAEEYKSWSENVVSLLVGKKELDKDSVVSKALQSDLDAVMALLNGQDWWRVSLDAETLFYIYLDVYQEASIEKQREMIVLLTDRGYAVPGNPEDFNLTNPQILDQIRLFAEELSSTLNTGTPYFLAGIILSAFYDTVNTDEFKKMQSDGSSLSEIFLSSCPHHCTAV